MFDYLYVSCPKCGYQIEDQTKNFDCMLQEIDLDKPQSAEIVECLSGSVFFCDECCTSFKMSSRNIGKIQMMKEIIN